MESPSRMGSHTPLDPTATVSNDDESSCQPLLSEEFLVANGIGRLQFTSVIITPKIEIPEIPLLMSLSPKAVPYRHEKGAKADIQTNGSKIPVPQYFAFKRGLHLSWPLKRQDLPIITALRAPYRASMQYSLRTSLAMVRDYAQANSYIRAGLGDQLQSFVAFLDAALEVQLGRLPESSFNAGSTKLQDEPDDDIGSSGMEDRVGWALLEGDILEPLPRLSECEASRDEESLMEWVYFHGTRILNDFYTSDVIEKCGEEEQREFEVFRQGILDALAPDDLEAVKLPSHPELKREEYTNICSSASLPTLIDIEALLTLQHDPNLIQDNEEVSASVAELLQRKDVDDGGSEDGSDELDDRDNNENDDPNIVAGSATRHLAERNASKLDTMNLAILSIEARLKRQGILHDIRNVEADEDQEDFLDDSNVFHALGLDPSGEAALPATAPRPASSLQDGISAMNKEEIELSSDDDEDVVWTSYLSELFTADNKVSRDGLKPSKMLTLLDRDRERSSSAADKAKAVVENWAQGVSVLGGLLISKPPQSSPSKPLPAPSGSKRDAEEVLTTILGVFKTPEALGDLLKPAYKEHFDGLNSDISDCSRPTLYYPTDCRPVAENLVCDMMQWRKVQRCLASLSKPLGPLLVGLLECVGHRLLQMLKDFDNVPFFVNKNKMNRRFVSETQLKGGNLRLTVATLAGGRLDGRPDSPEPIPEGTTATKEYHAKVRQTKKLQRIWDERHKSLSIAQFVEKRVNQWTKEALTPCLKSFFAVSFSFKQNHRIRAKNFLSKIKKAFLPSASDQEKEQGPTPSDNDADSELFRPVSKAKATTVLKAFVSLQDVFSNEEHMWETTILLSAALSWMVSTKSPDDWKEIVASAYYSCVEEALTHYRQLLDSLTMKMIYSPHFLSRFARDILNDSQSVKTRESSPSNRDDPGSKGTSKPPSSSTTASHDHIDDGFYDPLALVLAAHGNLWAVERTIMNALHNAKVKKAVTEGCKHVDVRTSSLFSVNGKGLYGPLFGAVQALRRLAMKSPVAPLSSHDTSALSSTPSKPKGSAATTTDKKKSNNKNDELPKEELSKNLGETEKCPDQMIEAADSEKQPAPPSLVDEVKRILGQNSSDWTRGSDCTDAITLFAREKVFRPIWKYRFEWPASWGVDPTKSTSKINVIVLEHGISHKTYVKEKFKGVNSGGTKRVFPNGDDLAPSKRARIN